MTSVEFYELIQLPEGVIEQLNEYEKQRKVDIPHEIMVKLFRREAWDEGVKELQAFYNKAIQQVFPNIIGDDREVIARITKSIETGEPITVQDKVYNFEERKLVRNSSDKSKLYVMIDSTKHYQHLKELEKEKQIADATNKAKSEFLANMSHEIRTPINAVLGMDEMILRECKDSTIKEYATDIQAAGNTLLTIINNILDLNKIESGKMEIIPVEYDVSSMIYDVSNMTKIRAKDKNLSFHVSVSPDIPMRMCGDLLEIIREKLPEEKIKACIQP